MWTNVGVRLGLPTSTLDNIAGTLSLDTPQKKAFKMLIKWHQLQTSASHVTQLVSALELEGRKDLAGKYHTYQQVRDIGGLLLHKYLVHSTVTDITFRQFFDIQVAPHRICNVLVVFVLYMITWSPLPYLAGKKKRLIILSSCFTDLKICYSHYGKSTRRFDFDFESSIPVNCEKSWDNNYFFLIG